MSLREKAKREGNLAVIMNNVHIYCVLDIFPYRKFPFNILFLKISLSKGKIEVFFGIAQKVLKLSGKTSNFL